MNIKLVLTIIALIQISSSILVPHVGKLKATKAPVYKLDLNVEPYHRWDHIAPDYKVPISKFITQVVDLLPIKDSYYQKLGLWGENNPLYSEYVEEIKGISDKVGVQWQKLFLVNFLYDLSTVIYLPACTSVLAKNSDGKIVHGRNLDFWPWKLFSRDTAKVQVYRGDNHIATFDQIIGCVMVLSGLRQDSGYSATVDTRYWHGKFSVIVDNIVKKNYVTPGVLLRNVLQEEQEYSKAIERLENTNVSSPIYFTVAGITEGEIIEKDMEGYRSVYGVSPSSKNWFSVVTNYDAEDGDPKSDDRKTPITNRLEKLGQENVNVDSIFKLMKQYPTLNIASFYTTVYTPYDDYNDLTLWYGNVDDYDNEEKSNLRGYIQDIINLEDLSVFDGILNSEIKKAEENGESFVQQIVDYSQEVLNE